MTKAEKLLQQIRNESELWKSAKRGGQDQYFGLPFFIPLIDAYFAEKEWVQNKKSGGAAKYQQAYLEQKNACRKCGVMRMTCKTCREKKGIET